MTEGDNFVNLNDHLLKKKTIFGIIEDIQIFNNNYIYYI